MTALSTSLRLLVVFPFTAMDSLPQAQSNEGRSIERELAAAKVHANNRPGWILEKAKHADLFEYTPIPMDHAFTVKVKYRYAGELEPLPYPED